MLFMRSIDGLCSHALKLIRPFLKRASSGGKRHERIRMWQLLQTGSQYPFWHFLHNGLFGEAARPTDLVGRDQAIMSLFPLLPLSGKAAVSYSSANLPRDSLLSETGQRNSVSASAMTSATVCYWLVPWWLVPFV